VDLAAVDPVAVAVVAMAVVRARSSIVNRCPCAARHRPQSPQHRSPVALAQGLLQQRAAPRDRTVSHVAGGGAAGAVVQAVPVPAMGTRARRRRRTAVRAASF